MIIKSINNTYGYKGLPDGFHIEFDDEVTYVVGDNFKTKSTILGVPLWVFTGYNMAGSNQEELADDRRNNLRYVMAEISFVDEKNKDAKLQGLTFVITGSINNFKNRNELVEYIESFGGKTTSSVSANLSYLINNDINSTSSKNKTAKQLGIKIITEDELIEMTK